jgi:hypothetical protein
VGGICSRLEEDYLLRPLQIVTATEATPSTLAMIGATDCWRRDALDSTHHTSRLPARVLNCFVNAIRADLHQLIYEIQQRRPPFSVIALRQTADD